MDKNIKVNIQADTTGVKSLRAELREVMNELQRAELGSAEFDRLNAKAAGLKDRMAEVNEQVAVFATGSKYEQVSNSLGEIGAGLRDMDFDRVTQGAKLFQKTASAITFKDAIGSVKQLGSAFLSIGKAILTNPLFLIVGVVTAIIAGIVALMDKLGILKKIFDFVGGAIDAVVQALKDFLDWIGLTTFAAEDAAERQAAAQEKIAQSYVDKQERVTDAYDQEIRLAKIAGKDTVELEKQKQYAIIETSQLQYKALNAQMEALRASGTLTKEKADEIRKAMLDLKKNIREARQEVQAINAQDVADNAAAAEAKLQKQREAAIKAKQIRDEAEKKRKQEEEERKQKEIKDFEEKKERMLKEAEELEVLVMQTSKRREEEEAKRLERNAQTRIDAAKQLQEQMQKQAQDALAQEKALQDARYFLAESTVKGLQGLAALLEQQGIKTAGLQKVIALVQIATDTAKAISSVIAGATAAAAAGGPAAPFLIAGYIASGIGTVLSAVASAQKALKSAPSLGGSVGGGTPISAPSGGAVPSTPNVSLFGNNNNANNLSSSKSVEVIQVQAVVSETEVTAKQKFVSNVQQMASL